MEVRKQKEWGDWVMKEVSHTLDPQVRAVRTLLEQKMGHFIEFEIGTHPLNLLFPTSTEHENLNRAEIDANSRERISGQASKFKKQVKNAIRNLYHIADVQSWDEKQVSNARKRLEEDIMVHLQDFSKALKSRETELTEFPKAPLHYRDLLGAAAMLQNELAAMTRNLDEHFMFVIHTPVEKRA